MRPTLRAVALALTLLLGLPQVTLAQFGGGFPGGFGGGFPGGGFGGGFPGGFGGGFPGGGFPGGGGLGQQGGVGQPATMVPHRMYQYASATGSGILYGPLIIQSQFGGAGGIGGQNYAGGGGTYGGLGGALGGLGGLGGGQQQGQYSMFPPGFQLHFSYNVLVGLPSQQGQLGGGFGQNPIGGGGFGGFPGGGFGGYGGFPGGFGGFGGFPGGFGGGFPGKGGFGNGGYGY